MINNPEPPYWILNTDNEISFLNKIIIRRNLKGFKFPITMSEEGKKEVIIFTKDVILSTYKNGVFLLGDEITPQVYNYLIERHLIQKGIPFFENKAIFINEKENLSILINHENHITLTYLYSDLNIEKAMDEITLIHDNLHVKMGFAFHNKFGYLTTSVKDVGTGIKFIFTLQFIALTMTNEIKKLKNSLEELDFGIKELKEQKQGLEFTFTIYNTLSTGIDLTKLKDYVIENINEVVKYEKEMRERLRDNNISLKDKVLRAYGILKNAIILTYDEAFNLLSLLKFGHIWFRNIKLGEINALLMLISPANLKAYLKNKIDEDINVSRAKVVKKFINHVSRI